FQAECISLSIDAAIFPDSSAVEKIAGIELQARRGHHDFHDASRMRIFNTRCGPQCSGGTVDDEIMVVSPREADLLVTAIADTKPDWLTLAEVERRASHLPHLAGRA